MIGQRLAAPAIALVAALAIVTIAMAQARQQCSAAAGSQGFWSWRMIDGRKCWYEGKPMLSKSLLEWPAQTEAQPDTSSEPVAASSETRSDPMNAQAYEPAESSTFEALWRNRIQMR